jgi:phage terminase small subunit
LGENVTPRQRKAIEALVLTGSKTDAAERAGVRRVTVYRWLRQPAFLAELERATSEAMDALSLALVGVGDLAIKTLEGGMAAGDASWSVRVRAADVALRHLLRLREMLDLEKRICRLEEQLGG